MSNKTQQSRFKCHRRLSNVSWSPIGQNLKAPFWLVLLNSCMKGGNLNGPRVRSLLAHFLSAGLSFSELLLPVGAYWRKRVASKAGGRCWGLVSWTLFEKTVGTKGISKPNFPSIIRCFSSYLSRNLWEVELWEMFLKFQRKTGNSGWLVFFSLTEKNLLTKTEAEIMRHFCV